MATVDFKFHAPNLLNHKPFKASNPQLFINSLHSQHITSCFSSRPTQLRASSHRSIPHLPVPYTLNSKFSPINCSLPPKKPVLKVFSEKAAIFLVGSFILLGSFRARPSLALPSKINLEQRRETEEMKSEKEEMWEKILEREPRNLEALKVTLHEKMRRGKTKEALKYVEKLIELEPNEVEWRLLQALCYEMLERFSTAKRLFKEILEERPLLVRALHGLSMVMHKNHEGPAVFGMLDKALEVARREKRLTEDRNIRILAAQMHVVQGQLEEGLKKFQDLVNEDPRDFRPYLCQGIIYSLLDQRQEAAEQFEIYQSLVPQEFPQRGFLDDVVLEARSKSREMLQKEFNAAYSYQKRNAAKKDNDMASPSMV